MPVTLKIIFDGFCAKKNGFVTILLFLAYYCPTQIQATVSFNLECIGSILIH